MSQYDSAQVETGSYLLLAHFADCYDQGEGCRVHEGAWEAEYEGQLLLACLLELC